MVEIRQGAPRNLMVFMSGTTLVFDSTVQIAGVTGLTLDVFLSKDGGAFTEITPTIAEVGYGWYDIALTASHLDTVGDLCLHIESIGANPADIRLNVVSNIVSDAMVELQDAVYGLNAIKNLIDAVQEDVGDPSASNTTLYDQLVTVRIATDELEPALVPAQQPNVTIANATQNINISIQDKILKPGDSAVFKETVADISGVAALVNKGWLTVTPA